MGLILQYNDGQTPWTKMKMKGCLFLKIAKFPA